MRAVFFLALVTSAAPPEDIVRQSWEAERLFDEGRYEAAANAYARITPLLSNVFGEAHARTLIAINNHSAALLHLLRAPQAEALLRDVLDRRSRAALPEDETAASAWNNLGEAFTLQEKFAASATVHERALEIRRRIHGPQHPAVAESLHNLGDAFRRSAEFVRAGKHLREALEIWRAQDRARPKMPGYAKSLNAIALLHSAQGEHREAEQSFREAAASAERVYGPSHEAAATIRFNLAVHYLSTRQWREADVECRRALDVFELLPEPYNARLAQMLETHARILNNLEGRAREARGQRERARHINSFQ